MHIHPQYIHTYAYVYICGVTNNLNFLSINYNNFEHLMVPKFKIQDFIKLPKTIQGINNIKKKKILPKKNTSLSPNKRFRLNILPIKRFYSTNQITDTKNLYKYVYTYIHTFVGIPTYVNTYKNILNITYTENTYRSVVCIRTKKKP